MVPFFPPLPTVAEMFRAETDPQNLETEDCAPFLEAATPQEIAGPNSRPY